MLRSPDRRTLQGRRDHAILAVLLATGIREAELCDLDVGDLATKWSHQVLTIRHGKGGKPRSMGVPDAVSEAVRAYLELREQPRPEQPLFLTLGKRGASPARITAKAVDYLVAVHARRALISKKVTPHLLRHCACSFALANGASPKEVQEMAGHSSLGVTNRYVHLLDTAATGAAKKSPLFR
jgi:site-specific recombinase XerD